jgi:hypothetical protein
MKKQIYFAATFLALVWGCSGNTSTQDTPNSQQTLSSQDAPASTSEDKTKEVLEHHWEAFIQNNMEAVMADYTEESVLITPDKTFRGLAEIQKNFEDAYVKFPKDQTRFQLTKSVIERDVAYILWQAETPTFDLTYATDTFVIRDGKIISQTYAGVSKARQK